MKVEVEEGDLVEDVIVIVKILRKGAPTGCSTVRLYNSPGMDRVTQIGMFALAKKAVGRGIR